jgi:hypothetical protein
MQRSGGIVDRIEPPGISKPLGYEVVECQLELSADSLVDHPPGRDRVAARWGALAGRVNVKAAEQLRFPLVEDGVGERLASGDSASWRARSSLSSS